MPISNGRKKEKNIKQKSINAISSQHRQVTSEAVELSSTVGSLSEPRVSPLRVAIGVSGAAKQKTTHTHTDTHEIVLRSHRQNKGQGDRPHSIANEVCVSEAETASQQYCLGYSSRGTQLSSDIPLPPCFCLGRVAFTGRSSMRVAEANR